MTDAGGEVRKWLANRVNGATTTAPDEPIKAGPEGHSAEGLGAVVTARPQKIHQ
jgi:hypothetical protein